jgi:hypothetical protein
LLTRCRPPHGYDGRCYIRATTNPDADSWVKELIDWTSWRGRGHTRGTLPAGGVLTRCRLCRLCRLPALPARPARAGVQVWWPDSVILYHRRQEVSTRRLTA